MNIKIGDLLFEEDNSNKIHEVFENNLLKEDNHEKNMTKVELDKINPLIARKIKSIYPGEEKILDDIEKTGEEEAPGSIKTGSLKLQGRNIGSGVEINIFNIYLDGDKVEGTDPKAGMKDLNKYEELGIIVFELVQGGETLSGENSQGHNIRQFFVIPFPGWKTSDKTLIDMHTKFFNIDFSDVDPEDFKGKPVFVHLGLGKKFHSFPIVEKDESGKEIKELRTALKNENLPKIMLFVEKSKLGTARSTISDKSEKTKQQSDRDTYTDQGEQQDDVDQQNKDITASVKESYIHKNTLSELLFEKKSLNKLSTKQKKVLVENYFNVNYSDLNNFQKRDYYTATKLLILNENNKLLTELTASQMKNQQKRSEELLKMSQEDIDNNYYGDTGPSSVEDAEKKIKALGSVADDAKPEQKSKIKSVIDKLSFWKKKSKEEESEDSNLKKVDSEASNSAFIDSGEPKDSSKDDSDDVSKSKEDEEVEDKEGEEGEEVEEKNKLQVSADIKTKEGQDLLKQLKSEAGDFAKYLGSSKEILQFIDSETSDYKKYLNSIPDYSQILSKLENNKKLKDVSEKDKDLAKQVIQETQTASNAFKEELTKCMNAFTKLKQRCSGLTSKARSSLSNKLGNGNEGADASKKEAVIDVMLLSCHSRSVEEVMLTSQAIRAMIGVYAQLHAPDDDLVNAVKSAEAQQKGDSASETEARLFGALMKLGATDDQVKSIIGNKTKLQSSKFIKNLNLLNPEYSNKDLISEIVKDKNTLKLGDKIVRNANGQINPSALKGFYDSLDKESAYLNIKNTFVSRFKDFTGKKIKDSSNDEIADALPEFFNSISSGYETKGWTYTGMKDLSISALKKSASALKWIFTTAIPKVIFYGLIGGVLYGGFKIIKFLTLGNAEMKAQILAWTGVGDWQQAMLELATWFDQFKAAPADELNALVTNMFGKSIDSLLNDVGSLKESLVAGLKSAGGASLTWLKAPWVAYSKGGVAAGLLAGFPATVFAFSQVAAWVLGLAGIGIASLGSLAAYCGWAAGGTALTNASLQMLSWGLDLSTRFAFGGLGPGDVLLLCGIAYGAYKLFKNKKSKDLDERLGKIFKLYVTSQAAGLGVEETARLLQMDFTQFKVEFYKELKPNKNEIKEIIRALKDPSRYTWFSSRKFTFDKPITTKEDLKEHIDAFEKYIEELEKDKKTDVKSSTLRILKEALESFENDHTACLAGAISDEKLADHYKENNHSFVSIVYSYLMQKTDHHTITDVDKISMINDKESLIESLQITRDVELSSIKKFGSFNVANDPISDIIMQITSVDKDAEVSGSYHVGNIIEGFIKDDKIKESDVDFDQIFNHLSSVRGNITANDLKQFQSTSWYDSKKIPGSDFFNTNKGAAQKYIDEFGAAISKNIASGLDMLVDKSVIEEAEKKGLLNSHFSKRGALINEGLISLATHNSNNDDAVGVLNESIAGFIKKSSGAILGGKLLALAGGFATPYVPAAAATAINTFATWFAVGIGAKFVAGALAVMLAVTLWNIIKKKLYVGNIDPYSDEDFKKALKPILLNCIRARVGVSYVSAMLRHKVQLEKVGIKISGENSSLFSDYNKALASEKQVRDLKRNMNDDADKLYKGIENVVYYVKAQNQNKQTGLGYYLTKPMIKDYVDSICLKKGAPLEEIFTAFQKEKEQNAQGSMNDGFVYEKGLGFILNEAPRNPSVSLAMSKVYSQCKDETYDFLYTKSDFNGNITNAILEILEPHLTWSLKKMFVQKRNFKIPLLPEKGPFKNHREAFFKETIASATSQVTLIDKQRILKILYSAGAQTEQTKIEKMQEPSAKRESFVHELGLGLLLEKGPVLHIVEPSDPNFSADDLRRYYQDGDIWSPIPSDSPSHPDNWKSSDVEIKHLKPPTEGGTPKSQTYSWDKDTNTLEKIGQPSTYDPDGGSKAVTLKLDTNKAGEIVSTKVPPQHVEAAVTGEPFPMQTPQEELAQACLSDEAISGGGKLFSAENCNDPLNFTQIKKLMASNYGNNTGKDQVYAMFKNGDGSHTQIYLSNSEGGTWTEMSTDANGKVLNFNRITADNLPDIASKVEGSTSMDLNGEDVKEVFGQLRYTRTVKSASKSFDGDSVKIEPLEPIPSKPVGTGGAREYNLDAASAKASNVVEGGIQGYNPTVADNAHQIGTTCEVEGGTELVKNMCGPSPDQNMSTISEGDATTQEIDDFINDDVALTDEPGDQLPTEDESILADKTGEDLPEPDDNFEFDADAESTEFNIDRTGGEFGDWNGIDEMVNSIISNMAWALLGAKIFDFLAAAPMEQKTVIPLMRGIDWARIPEANLSAGIISFLVSNKEKLKEMNVNIVGDLPSEVMDMNRQVGKDFGETPEISGELAVLSKSAAKRLQKNLTKGMSPKKAAKIKITEQDVANALKKDLSKMVYSYHKAYNTDTFQRIEDNVNDNFTKGKRKEARGTVNRKTNIGLAGMLVGGAMTLTGFGSAIGIPMMVAGGSVYSNRAGTFEDDQLVGGDERESELNSQIKKLTKEDVETLTEIIIDISKEAKGIDESSLLDGDLIAEVFNDLLHKNKLSYLLFNEEDKTKTANVGYPVSKVKDYLQGRSVMCYDGTLTPGSKVFEKAEAFTLSSICSLLRSMCGITISGLEPYREPAAVAAKAETYANASVNAKAPVGKPAMPSLAAISADAPAPQMNQPINPTQFAAMINNSGGKNAKTFTRFMMYHMLLQQTGGDSDRALKQLEDFLQAMGEGKVTTKEAIDTASSMVGSADESVRTTASQDADGNDTTTTTTSDSFASALEDSVKELNRILPNVRQSDITKIFKNLSKINEIVLHDDLKNVLSLTDHGKKIFPNEISSKSLKDFGEHYLSGRINIVKDENITNYNNSDAKAISVSLFRMMLNRPLIIAIDFDNIKSNLSNSDNVDIHDTAAFLEDCLLKYFINKVLNNAISSSLNVEISDIENWNTSENITAWFTEDDDLRVLKSYLEAIKSFSDKLNESQITRKAVIDNRVRRKRKEFVKEDYLMGDLSSLLFNESVSIEGKKKKEVKLSNSNINLSKEWLKIWDI